MRVLQRKTRGVLWKATLAALVIVLAVVTAICVTGAKTVNAESRVGALELTDDDFSTFKGETRLWSLAISGRGDYGTLTDRAVYRDGNDIVYGELDDAYARFRDLDLLLELNPEYEIGSGAAIGDLLRGGVTAEYLHYDAQNPSVSLSAPRGSENGVAHIRTVVMLDFKNSDYTVSDRTCDNYVIRNGVLTIEKDWYIVNIANLLRDRRGNIAEFDDIVYGEKIADSSPRPEHGNSVVWTLSRGNRRVTRFAVEFAADGSERLYRTNFDGTQIDKNEPVEGSFVSVLGDLDVGNYTLTGYIPSIRYDGNHNHWWTGGGNIDDAGTYYHEITHRFDFKVSPYDMAETFTDREDEKKVTVDRKLVPFTGSPIEPLDIVVRFGDTDTPEEQRRVLEYGTDYTLEFANNVNAGRIQVKVIGKNNFVGVKISDRVTITHVENGWSATPHINRWIYGTYDREVNSITAVPKFMHADAKVSFSVLTGEDTKTPVSGLENFTLEYDEVAGEMLVGEETAALLGKLDAGSYTLRAIVGSTTSYGALETDVDFKVLQAENRWASEVSVIPWASDAFDAGINHFTTVPLYGKPDDVNIVIRNADGEVVYDSKVDTTDKLGKLKKGKYSMTASVEETVNYKGLTGTAEFEVERGSTEIVVAIVVISVFDLLLIAALVVLFLLARRRTDR